MAKVQVIVTDDQGRDVPFGTKTLTKEFKNKAGKTYAVAIEEPGKTRTVVGNYTVQGSAPPPPPDQPMKVSAGDDVDTVEGQLVILDGSASDDNHSIIRATWTQVQGPQVVLTVDPQDNTNVSFTAPAVDVASVQLVFQLEAENDAGDIKQDQVIVTVRDISIPPPPPPTGLLYSSNTDGQWNNGIHRTVKNAEGKITPNGKGLYTAASGNPELEILGDGTARLKCNTGHGRIYICACNYNSLLELEYNIESENIANVSLKTRSRHQQGGVCSNRFGGFGNATSFTGSDFQTESCHNNHENKITGNLPKKIQIGQWIKKRYQCKNSADNKQVEFTEWIDFNDGNGFVKTLEGKHTHPQAFYMDKASFDEESYFWIRLNIDSGSGSVLFRNVNMKAI